MNPNKSNNFAVVGLVVSCFALAPCVIASSHPTSLTDPMGDASPRPTDPGGSGEFDPSAAPDFISAAVIPWEPTDPANDPYSGAEASPNSAHLVRIDLVFAGIINPPGPLGLGMGAFFPTKFGDRPLYGVLELDVDGDRNSGGELEAIAQSRFLGNVARFGGLPESSFGERALRSIDDIDGNYNLGPQFERSGAEFTLIMCGCFDPSIVDEDGNEDGKFDAGETWIVEGRFFERMQMIKPWSGVGGGSDLGLYDPIVRLRFEHSIIDNLTTVTFVYALDMTGAAQLAGESLQFSDYDVANHSSIQEALDDLIEVAEGFGGPIQNPAVDDMIDQWDGEHSSEFLNVENWNCNAIFGTAYTSPASSLYVWTDVAGSLSEGDFNTDSLVDSIDRDALSNEISLLDGTGADADGAVNGAVVIPQHPANFSLFDLEYDGVLDSADLARFDSIAPLPGDINSDCFVDTADLGILVGQFGSMGSADLNADGIVDTADLGLLIGAFGTTCLP